MYFRSTSQTHKIGHQDFIPFEAEDVDNDQQPLSHSEKDSKIIFSPKNKTTKGERTSVPGAYNLSPSHDRQEGYKSPIRAEAKRITPDIQKQKELNKRSSKVPPALTHIEKEGGKEGKEPVAMIDSRLDKSEFISKGRRVRRQSNQPQQQQKNE